MRTVAWLLAVALLLAGGAAVGLRSLDQPYQAFTTPEVFVDIPPGTGVAAIGHRLVEAGVVKSDWAFRFAGTARATAVVDQLVAGDVVLRPITFREGLTIADMAAHFAEAGLGSAAAFVAAAGRGPLVAEIDAGAGDLEGYLFPETYNLPRDTSAQLLVDRMAQRFLAVYDDGLRAKAKASHLTTREVVTLASLVEKETSRAEERPLVAAVYVNRMRIGMGMQCDPTVIYALQRAGAWRGNLTRDNLMFDSPYNTYRYRGLPPGPIAAPGRASLEAAVAPASVPYLYFVSRNDGSHVFASTLDEHNRNVQQFQVQYFRDQRRREGR